MTKTKKTNPVPVNTNTKDAIAVMPSLTFKTVSFYNTKGGVGKTTLSLSLYAYLTKIGFPVIGIDCDQQRNFSQADSSVKFVKYQELSTYLQKVPKKYKLVIIDLPFFSPQDDPWNLVLDYLFIPTTINDHQATTKFIGSLGNSFCTPGNTFVLLNNVTDKLTHNTFIEEFYDRYHYLSNNVIPLVYAVSFTHGKDGIKKIANSRLIKLIAEAVQQNNQE